jgi:UDP-GlcNAc3NAcA epimerase
LIKIATIIGARPQFIKASTVSRAISHRPSNGKWNAPIREIIIHTGQHYDFNMSRLFFEQLGIPDPEHHLEIGSGLHGDMTGRMLAKLEEVLLNERLDWVLVYGDTNSTLAGALAAAKLHLPVAHVEAGLRSFNKRMPEEINRVLTDHVSQILFAPTETAVENLRKEGITEGVSNVGDVMLDAFLFHQATAAGQSTILNELQMKKGQYFLATIHRQENTDDPVRLFRIIKALETVAHKSFNVILPLHPRTRKILQKNDLLPPEGSVLRFIEPVGYVDMIHLEANAALIFTDSGGVQKEAYFAGVPCVTLRDETEWVETVEAGVNFLAGAETDSIIAAYERARAVDVKLKPGLYGNGHAAEAIVKHLLKEA